MIAMTGRGLESDNASCRREGPDMGPREEAANVEGARGTEMNGNTQPGTGAETFEKDQGFEDVS